MPKKHKSSKILDKKNSMKLIYFNLENYKERNRNNQLNHVNNGGISSNKWQNNRLGSSNKKNYITRKYKVWTEFC